MADGLFGTPTGFRTYDRDQAELGLLAGQTRHQDALSGLNRAQAEVLLRKQSNEEAKTAALAGIAGGGPSPMGTADAFEGLIEQGQRVAGALFSVGDIEGAQKAANEAATLLSRTASAGAAQARKAVSEGQVLDQKAERIQQYLSGVRDAASHASALLAIRSDPLLREDGVPPELETYNQRVVNSYINGTEALRRQVATTSDQARTASYVATQAAQRGRVAILNEQGEKRLELEERRVENLGKGGGTSDKPTGPPSTAAVKAMTTDLGAAGLLVSGAAGEAQALELAERAKRLVHSTKGALTETEARGEAQALELAERAKRLVHSTKGALTETEARARVIQEAQAAGEIMPPEPEKSFVPDWAGGAAKPGSFSPQLGTITRPRTLTPGGTAKVGEYIRDPATGTVMQATKEGWKPVARSAMTNPLAEDEDEGGEE